MLGEPQIISSNTVSLMESNNIAPGTIASGQVDSLLGETPNESYAAVVRHWAAYMDLASAHGTQLTSDTQSTSAATTTAPSRSPVYMRRERILGMHKWTGFITCIEDGVLTAELVPLDHDGPWMLADFDLELLAPDESTAMVGDVVYLTTRLIQGRWGHKEATSHLRLRRLGRWSEDELAGINLKATDRARSFAKYEDRPPRG